MNFILYIFAAINESPHKMKRFEDRKLLEILLYILGKTGGMDIYHAFKILYFAEMQHLSKWGSGFVPDEFHALKYGPVPTRLYNAIKEMDKPAVPLAVLLADNVRTAGEDAPNVLLPKRMADENYLSISEREALTNSISENACLSFGRLMNKSHDKAWEEAAVNTNGNKAISPLKIAEVLNAENSVIEYIKDQMQLDNYLR